MAAPAAPLASAPSGGAAPPFRGPGPEDKPRDQTSRQRGALRKQTWKLNEIDAV